MKWLDPMPTDCPACGDRFSIPVDALRSLQAVCPGCGASLAATGESMLSVEARFKREVGPILVGVEVEERTGMRIPDSVFDAEPSLNVLVRAVADRLPPAADREAKAAELVVEAARRSGSSWLLGEAGSEVVRAWLAPTSDGEEAKAR
jgi:hypothetical protein